MVTIWIPGYGVPRRSEERQPGWAAGLAPLPPPPSGREIQCVSPLEARDVIEQEKRAASVIGTRIALRHHGLPRGVLYRVASGSGSWIGEIKYRTPR